MNAISKHTRRKNGKNDRIDHQYFKFRFRLKYHPEEGKQHVEERQKNLQKRLEIFNELLVNGRFDELGLSYEKAESIIRIFNEGLSGIIIVKLICLL